MTPIRVLVVDDSAFARKVLRESLTAAGIEVVGIARDGLEALEKIAELKPDVVTLDLVMPNLDGLGVLAALAQMAQLGRPRVVVVSMSDDDTGLGIAALHAGAIEVVKKPTALAIDRLYDLAGELVAAVRAAAGVQPRAALETSAPTAPLVLPPVKEPSKSIVVIGASTGGPQALTRLLTALPASFPVPIALVLHLPVGYTQSFAERLNHESKLEVLEAAPGLELRPGRAIVARAGVHLRFARRGDSVQAALDPLPLTTPHRPAVDVLFESAAQVFGARVLGVVLTGMGDDGTAGARTIHAAGGELITEAEQSCVVYGMPRCVFEAGLSSASVPLSGMAAELLRRI